MKSNIFGSDPTKLCPCNDVQGLKATKLMYPWVNNKHIMMLLAAANGGKIQKHDNF